MTRLNYSNLPPEAQEAIKKLTGLTDDQLEHNFAQLPKAEPEKPSKTELAKDEAIGCFITTLIVGVLVIITAIWALAQMFGC